MTHWDGPWRQRFVRRQDCEKRERAAMEEGENRDNDATALSNKQQSDGPWEEHRDRQRGERQHVTATATTTH